ncbi:hypothetical protein V493_08155 [Pseudogymnoascus sp. VKM F-4281 (FW-2241)]|nr:hypothetical protein V493_08155 [Pseudogymnoascus sp. VKM F-4281 (FW-2241)]
MSGHDGRRRDEHDATRAHGDRHALRIDEEPYLGPPVTPALGRDQNGNVEITTGQKMLSAVSGSLFTSLIVTPLDVVRVRLQSQPNPSINAAVTNLTRTATVEGFGALPPNLGVTACCREVFFAGNAIEYCVAGPSIGTLRPANAIGAIDCSMEETQRRTFNSTLDAFRKISRNEGITTLWRGLSPTLVMTVPANIIYFTGYDWLRFAPASPVNRLFHDSYAPLVAGSFARVVAAIVVSPIEMFKTRMQASHGAITGGGGHFAKTLNSVREMTRTSGYASLWRGLTLTLWRDVPFSGIYWWGYETVRGQLTDARERARGREFDRDGPPSRERSRSQSRENHTNTFTDSFTAGAVSGAIASILTMPFDVGKTRQQIFKDRVGATGGALAPEQLSMPRFLMHIFREEGVPGLWRGWAARTMKVAPACAIMISCYEVGKRMSRVFNEKAEERRVGGL